MGYSLSSILFMFLFVLPYSSFAQGDGTLPVGSSLTAGDNGASWYSPSGEFAFGFQKVEENDQFLLSIWYDKIPDKTMVWFVNDGTTAPAGSKVQLTADGGLVLSDSRGKDLWGSAAFSGTATSAALNDTGNFVILGSDSTKVWDSFGNPSDTLLPTQVMDNGGVLYSKRSESNFSRGRFQLRLLPDGNLVLNTRDIPSDYAYNAYYRSGTHDPSNTSNSGVQVRFNQTGNMYIVRRNGGIFDLNSKGQGSGSYYRATLDFDGVFVLYSHPKVFTGNPNWTAVWSQPENICIDLLTDQGSGACGFNSVCRLGDSGRPTCECPKSYSLIDPTDKYGSCKPNFIESCEDEGSSSKEELYDFWELTDTDWPTSDYEQLNPVLRTDCKRYCLNDCLCAVAIYRGNSCWKKKLPLSNGRNNRSEPNVIGTAFIKYRKGDLPQGCPNNRTKDQGRGRLTTAGSVLLGGSVSINLILVAAAFFGYLCVYRKKNKEFPSGANSFISSMRSFTYKELEQATNGFQEELGRGAFAIVYKGVVQMSSSNILIAVKRLDRVVQDADKEFKTEVNVIAQTHQRNLVRLLGYCDDGENRLLIYEYMVNGTLASFIFGHVKPSWTERKKIALGVARGLSYLHDECSKQIIHCDIKPQNILLDENYNARISDFGLAKLLMMNQSRTNTGIRGTKGYVAPEWFRNTPVTVKVDVYSFGVVLLEMICCRRSVEDSENEQAILTYWVWDCFEQGELEKIVENREDMIDDWEKLERFVMVGIWCIQEDPSLRPTMKEVILMLEGVVDVAKPPCPSPFSVISS